ncbi:ATP-dependent Clp protease adapter ClpS [Pseudoglutamicibacter albus]|nr:MULTISPECIES: ATP-dependent Clp protease adapter ClpS [Pseudoglutamicibacter]MDK7082497.1 ATP-dependent Clp protease adapter ClpS [Pseudoglutamicibacter cumminsii]PKY81105.1 ATP-dependent Clp protease adapter ClpS [Pseudoglutamicibacter albus]WIK84243.1 ATP-dependent Clp protease adapter ClpS [Pseudoglutamicibacter albus]
MASMAPATSTSYQVEKESALAPLAARPFELVVWDDPVNLMSYVSYVFRTYFGYSDEVAQKLMLEVHHSGRAVVARGPREKIETDVEAMHGYGLQATMREGGV